MGCDDSCVLTAYRIRPSIKLCAYGLLLICVPFRSGSLPVAAAFRSALNMLTCGLHVPLTIGHLMCHDSRLREDAAYTIA